MINPNKNMTENALGGALLLRKHAENLAEAPHILARIIAEPHIIAADAIEHLVKENTELRAQLVAFQKAANPVVAADFTHNGDDDTRYTLFVKGARVRLKASPHQYGTIADTVIDPRNGHLCFVCFHSAFENDRWVKARLLERLPDTE